MRAGELLAGKYRIEAPIGEGAMGAVWRATQLGLDRPVAIKILHANLATRADARARFVREARVAAALHHPNAVRVLDFGETPAGLFLVMELLVGTTLRERLEDGALPRIEALHIAAQIADVLEAAHRVNLVHRDIKPENTFLETVDGGVRVRVVDFGLAFISDGGGPVGRLTEEGILGGTPMYLSPEQARGKTVGPPSDVYSLGCTLYEMLAGRPPFMGNVAELITRHAYTPALTLRELDLEPPIPLELDDLVLTMLEKTPPLRPTAQRVADELIEMIASSTAPAASPLRLRERASRVLPRPDPHAAATVRADASAAGAEPDDGDGDSDDAPLAIRVEGALDDALRLALAAGGVSVLAAGDDAAPLAVFAPGAAIDRLTALAAGPVPVVTDVDGGDFDGIAARVRAGCRDAVTRPVRPDALVRKLRRVARQRHVA